MMFWVKRDTYELIRMGFWLTQILNEINNFIALTEYVEVGCPRHPRATTIGIQLQDGDHTDGWQNLTTQPWAPTPLIRQAPVTQIHSEMNCILKKFSLKFFKVLIPILKTNQIVQWITLPAKNWLISLSLISRQWFWLTLKLERGISL